MKLANKNSVIKIMSLIHILFLPLLAQAYQSISCNSDSLSVCLLELSELLGFESNDSCELQELSFEQGTVRHSEFYTFTCLELKWFIKKQIVSRYNEDSLILDYLSKNSSPELCSAFACPVAELSLSNQKGVYYKIFPHIEGKTLSALKEEMYQNNLERSKLSGLYRSIGSVLGFMHKAGEADHNNDVVSFRSQLVHGDLHDANIIIKPDGGIVFVDIDGLSNSLKSPQYLTTDIQAVTLQVLPMPILLLDDPLLTDWLDAIPEFTTNFVESYCESLSTMDIEHCHAQVKNYMATLLRSTHQDVTERDGSTASSDELESAQYVNSDELEKRLESLL